MTYKNWLALNMIPYRRAYMLSRLFKILFKNENPSVKQVITTFREKGVETYSNVSLGYMRGDHIRSEWQRIILHTELDTQKNLATDRSLADDIRKTAIYALGHSPNPTSRFLRGRVIMGLAEDPTESISIRSDALSTLPSRILNGRMLYGDNRHDMELKVRAAERLGSDDEGSFEAFGVVLDPSQPMEVKLACISGMVMDSFPNDFIFDPDNPEELRVAVIRRENVATGSSKGISRLLKLLLNQDNSLAIRVASIERLLTVGCLTFVGLAIDSINQMMLAFEKIATDQIEPLELRAAALHGISPDNPIRSRIATDVLQPEILRTAALLYRGFIWRITVGCDASQLVRQLATDVGQSLSLRMKIIETSRPFYCGDYLYKSLAIDSSQDPEIRGACLKKLPCMSVKLLTDTSVRGSLRKHAFETYTFKDGYSKIDLG